MKRIAAFSYVLLAMFLVLACGSDDQPEEEPYVCGYCASSPEALPADDNRPTGIYKGVVTGDGISGTLKAEIATDEQTGSCRMVVNGATLDAGSFSIDAVGPDSEYTFTAERYVFVLLLAPNGEVKDASVELDGASVNVDVAKEDSTTLVRCFEGGWSGSGYSGVWNVIVAGETLEGTYDGDDYGSYTGTVSGNSATIYQGESELAQGTFSGDEASGSWSTSGVSGAWSGKRTL